jgi:F-type H+-transporting ATPase subunit b
MRYVSVFLTILVTLVVATLVLGTLRDLLGGVLVASAAGRAGLLEVNVTLVVQALSYLVFLRAMELVLFRPMTRHLDERKQELERSEKAAAEAGRAVVEVRRQREERLGEVLREVGKECARLRAGSVDEYQRTVAEARREAEVRLEECRAAVAAEAEVAERALDGQVDEFAAAIRQRLVGPGART